MGLAPILVKEIFHIIREINEQGTTILLVEQNARMALSVADRAYVGRTGEHHCSSGDRRRARAEPGDPESVFGRLIACL